jgi:crotonobetaine/carnitine-CoA ligase
MFWSDVSRAGSTVLPFVGDMLALLSKNEVTPDEQRSSLRVGYGVPIPAGLHLELEERFSMQLVHAYGSTEATIPVWSAGSERIPGSAGRVIDGFDVQIWDDSHQQLGVDAVGEIVVRAHLPNMMFSGYYKDEGRTSAAWSGGWFLSGDYGCFDQYGNLWFKGRRDEAIRHHGELIHPTGLEEIAEAHHAISGAAVVGVRSELAEDDILMVVELAPGCDLAAADLHTWLAERCARFELPRYIEFTGQLPRTPTGKVERYRLKDRGPTQGAYDSRQARSSYG